jgi:hypothetical protein
MESLSQANTFELSGKSIHVSYSSTSFTGVPLFSYRDDRLSRSFSGEEIHVEDTDVGQLVTVTLEAVADGDRVTFSLVLPIVTLRKREYWNPYQSPGTHRHKSINDCWATARTA